MVRPLRALRAFCSSSSLFALLAIAIAGVPVVGAQELPPATGADAPAHVAFVDGVAILERDGETDDAPTSMPLLAGDRVRTRAGRVEILFADGATLHLDHHTVIDLQSDELVRLIGGRIRLAIPGPRRTVGYRVDGPHGWALIDEPGEYRVTLLNTPGGSEQELAVLRGRAELANDGGTTALRAGERAFVRAAAAPSYAFVANSAALDAFDRWSERRRSERLGASAEYLADEVRPYAASLDRHGYWREEPAYGRVWYPRVEADWRPYYRGRWANLRPYGWTWVGHDPWGWPTHHYGRWGHGGGGWFWIPGRSWGAAWVSWASAPGYVSWCPLGWNNRPVFQINARAGYGYDAWRAWTVVPDRSFGRGYVHRNLVRIDHLDYRTRGAFRVAERAPMPQGYVGPRAATAIRTAGANGGRRPSSPVYSNLPADRGRVRTDGARVQLPDAAESRRAETAGASTVARERTTPGRSATRVARPADTAPGGRVVHGGQVPRSAEGARQTPPQTQDYAIERPSTGGLERRPPGGVLAPRRAVPRDDPRPSTVEPRRAAPPDRRGPERPSPAPSERRGPSAPQPPPAQPSVPQPSGAPRAGGDRPAAGSPGARPRPSGGAGSGATSVRRPGGGRTEGQ